MKRQLRDALALGQIDLLIHHMEIEPGQEARWVAKQHALLNVREEIELQQLWEERLD